MSLHYRTNKLMHTFGDDFNYASAHMNFKNIDKLIKYINSHPEFNMTLMYSTPSQYLEVLSKENVSLPTNYYDFLPYADQPKSFWTGYFTSRPALKGLVKYTGRYMNSLRNYISFLDYNNMSSYVLNN
mmetsp:Transcript_129118/g.182065  ORF Transcript_129118/g.182065 Transcript_129118/m.182065 type:complete len:128 (+) Transcript_129118:430-813(+)